MPTQETHITAKNREEEKKRMEKEEFANGNEKESKDKCSYCKI